MDPAGLDDVPAGRSHPAPMWRSKPNEAGRTIDPVSLHVLVSLAEGRAPVAEPASWLALFALARRERVLGLTWSRSSSIIRRLAPPEVAASWQRQALTLGVYGQRQLDELALAVRALREADIGVVVLKGAPLSLRLYGDPTVRPTLDSDLYIPLEQRRESARILADAGWRVTSAQWPEEERLERRVGEHNFVLEVHSSAIDDASLDHIRMPVDYVCTKVGEYELPAHTGRFLPPYLATHLVKHHEKPLLWILDFATLWRSLDEADQHEARLAARRIGLIRHLDWAIRLVRDIATVASAPAAIRSINRALEVKTDFGRVAQLIALSSSPADACRVLGGRIWPPAWRRGWRAAPGYFARRAVAWAYRHLVFESPSGSESSSSVLSLEEPDCATRLTNTLGNSQVVWVSSVGQNMAPAVPLFGSARIVSSLRRELKIGDVVVVRSYGQCTLERVIRLTSNAVIVKPDALMTREHPVGRDDILGICDLVQVGAARIPIERRPYGNMGMVRAIVRSRFGALSVADAHHE